MISTLILVVAFACCGITTLRVALGVLPQIADPIDPLSRRVVLAIEGLLLLICGIVTVGVAVLLVAMRHGY